MHHDSSQYVHELDTHELDVVLPSFMRNSVCAIPPSSPALLSACRIGRAIAAYEQAASCLSYDDPRLGRFLRNIGVGYLDHYTAEEHPDFPDS